MRTTRNLWCFLELKSTLQNSRYFYIDIVGATDDLADSDPFDAHRERDGTHARLAGAEIIRCGGAARWRPLPSWDRTRETLNAIAHAVQKSGTAYLADTAFPSSGCLSTTIKGGPGRHAHVLDGSTGCAWLIRRHIDEDARILWLASPAECPDSALGFDFDGARFSHAGAKVTFENLVTAFGLQSKGMDRLGAIVHFLDVGGVQPPEAAGVEQVLAGLRATIADDDQPWRSPAESSMGSWPASRRRAEHEHANPGHCHAHWRARRQGARATPAGQLPAGVLVLVEAGVHQFWRPGRADRHHAHRAGGTPTLDQ